MDWPQLRCYFHYQRVRTELLWGGGVVSEEKSDILMFPCRNILVQRAGFLLTMSRTHPAQHSEQGSGEDGLCNGALWQITAVNSGPYRGFLP